MKALLQKIKTWFGNLTAMQRITLAICAATILCLAIIVVIHSNNDEFIINKHYFASAKNIKGAHNVLVVHSWGKEYADDSHYHQLFVKEFEKNGTKVNLYHIFIDAKHNTLDFYEKTEFPHMRNIIERRWKPELITICDDPAMEWLLTYHANDPLFKNTPIVFSGVTVLQKDILKKEFPLATGFQDTIALAENLNLIKEVRGDYCTAINIDETERDMILRKDIIRQMNNIPNVINNSDFHLSLDEVVNMPEKDNKSFIVAFISSDSPASNSSTRNYDEGRERLHELYRNADKHTQLQITYSLYSNTLIDRSSRPQFSAICEQFGTRGRPRILCGYFTSIETEIEDKAFYGSKILQGIKPSELPITYHKKGYYMDFNALKRIYTGDALQEKYDEFKKKFTIINTPYEVAHPILAMAIPALIAVIAIIALIVIILHVMKWRSRTQMRQQEAARRKYNQRKKLFAMAKATTWYLNTEQRNVHITHTTHSNKPGEVLDISVDDLKKLIHPDSLHIITKILNSLNKRGNYSERVQFSLDGGNTYYWEQISYSVTAESQRTHKYMGVMLDITKTIEIENKLKEAYAQANEVRMKEEFLINFDESILQQMEELTDAADNLAQNSDKLQLEEKIQIADTVRKKTGELLQKLDDAIGKAETAKQERNKSVSGITASIIAILLCMATTLGFTSCQPENEQIHRKVLVIHSYGKQLPDYVKFDSLIHQEFLSHNIKPDIRDLYVDMIDETRTGYEQYKTMADSLKRSNWEPDVILVEGDEAVKAMSLECNDSLMPFVKTKPIVYGGLYVPEWQSIRTDHNSIIFYSPVDFNYNIGIATLLSKQNVVEIELDDTPKDSVLRQQLANAVNHPPFINNSDFHEHRLSTTDLNTIFKDSVIVITLSAKNHRCNVCSNPAHADLFEQNTRSIYTYSSKYASIAVKKDVYANSIIDKTGKPEFTAIREGFEDGEDKFLAGYFASYETVAADMVRAADGLLRNHDVFAVAIFNHKQKSYMNYNAMQQLGLEYDDFKDHYEIIGAPYEVSNPLEHWLILIGIILGVLVLIGIVSYRVIGRYYYRIYKLQKQISDEQELCDIALEGKNRMPILSAQDLLHIIPNIHPDSHDIQQEITISVTTPGTYEFETQIRHKRKGIYQWWKLFYIVDLDANGELSYDGLMFTTDEEHQKIEELNQAIRIADEARAKENFLIKLRHELHTPLNIILGSCDILASDLSNEMTPEETKEYTEGIMQNRAALHMMINDLITYSQIDRDRLHYNMQDINVGQFVQQGYQSTLPIVPKYLKSRLAKGADDIYINVDPRLLTNIMRQFVNNACKYTDVGGIAVGWQKHISSQEAEIYVQDTGRGIAKDKQKAIFEMFWKDDGFVPGLGVGLHIAKLLTEGMGGRIHVDSQPHKGSRFSLFFKMVEPAIPAPTTNDTPSKPTETTLFD